MKRGAFAMLLTAPAILAACRHASDNQPITSASIDCRPVDGAWAIAVHVRDAATRQAVADADVWAGTLAGAPTDSSGWSCIRTLVSAAETVRVYRPGYRSDSFAVTRVAGEVVVLERRFHRVAAPCCDLRGQWRITFKLDSAAALGPRPSGRTVEGLVELSPRLHPPEMGDDLDSLVRVVRGLHSVDFRPFFGGPVAEDVSTTISGGGPNLLREVMASITDGDRVEITFIPRMSHGSLSLIGRIRSDTIRGPWVQNAFCCGAHGTFVMVRTAPPDTTPFPRASRPPEAVDARRWREPDSTPPGRIPGGRWRPQLAVAPNGRLWFARRGLFVADSVHGAWRLVLGKPTDPVEADELNIGLAMEFVAGDTVLIAVDRRYPMSGAPLVYRTENAGKTWSPVVIPDLDAVGAMSAVGRSTWIGTERVDGTAVLFRSSDGGKTWSGPDVLHGVREPAGLYRASDSVGFLYGHTEPGNPALWLTIDGGRRWTPVPTPSEQGLHTVPRSGTRIEEMAVAGTRLLVREHGRVFVSTMPPGRWRLMPGLDHIAGDGAHRRVFVLTDSLVPRLLDENLNNVWPNASPLPISATSYFEQAVFRDSIAYVTEGHGSIHEVRGGKSRVVRP